MATIKFLNTDVLTYWLRRNIDKVIVNPNPPLKMQFEFTSAEAPILGSLSQFKIPLNSIQSILNDNNGLEYRYNSFKFVTNGKANVEQVVNYNAIPYYDFVELEPESSLFSIYQTTLSDSEVFENNPSRELFLEPQPNIESFEVPRMLSVSPSLDMGYVAQYKGIFPTFVDIQLPEISDNKILNLFHDNQLYEAMIEGIVKSIPTTHQYETNLGTISYETYSLSQVLSSIPSSTGDWQLSHILNYEEDYIPDVAWNPAIRQLISSDATDLIKSNTYSYKRLLTEDFYITNEILCYKIEKFSKGGVSVLQTFFVPAMGGINNFIDTQVKFGKEYRYRVTAIVASYDLFYKYNININNQVAEIEIAEDKGDLRLVSIPILEKDVLIESYAPSTPEISFFNQSNEEKKIKVYFEPSYIETREEFIEIQDSDKDTQSNAKVDVDGKMVFKYSEDSLVYEIYKLNQKPKSYYDFKDALYADVSNNTPANSEVFEMFLTPNRKFYFMFRAINGFRLASNPTAVYELELVQDSDETRVVAKTIKFEEEGNQRTRTFGRFMKIYPAFDQININEWAGQDNSNATFQYNNSSFYVGSTTNPIWGRKFKIRVRSRNTGKMVDLNVDFVLNKIESEEDFT